MSTPTGPATADSVRLAWPAEASALAEVQRRSWSHLSPALYEAVTLADMVVGWERLISRPAEARHRVLVAVERGRVVGYAITAPAADPDADPGRDGEIDQLVVDEPARTRGHGSRLLNAAVDTLRADGFTRGRCWVPDDDRRLTQFFTSAGWVSDGAAREVGTEDGSVRLRQVRLHTDLETG